VIPLKQGVECDISVGTKFQFQADDGDTPLEIIITTTPPWPGDGEAIKCSGKWTPVL
jgi:mannose-6-phosphate isomerase-like protein (cupin superfamily)